MAVGTVRQKKKPTEDSHTTARVYLEGFSTDSMLAVFDKHMRKQRPQPVATTGILKKFYTITLPDGKQSDALESILGTYVEGPMAPVFDKLRRLQDLNREDTGILFSFVAVQKLRTHGQRQAHEEHVRRKGGVVDPNLFVRALIQVAPKLAQQLWSLNVQLLIAPLGYSFCTSDDPVVILGISDDRYIPNFEQVFAPVDVLLHPKSKCFMPLTSKVCLVAEGSGKFLGYRDAACREVNEINRLVGDHAERFIYANDNRDLVQVAHFLDLD
jgi:hypothetical protein